jgi:hypothetical protein
MAPLPAAGEGKDLPSKQPLEKGAKLFQDIKDDLLLRIAEPKTDMYATRDDAAAVAANRGVEVVPNESNVINRGRTTLYKDQSRLYVFYPPPFDAALTLINCQGKG